MKNTKDRQDGPVKLRSPKGVAQSLMTEVETDNDSANSTPVPKSSSKTAVSEKNWNTGEVDELTLILPIGNRK